MLRGVGFHGSITRNTSSRRRIEYHGIVVVEQSSGRKDISKIIKEYIGWEKNTTYTVINRLIEKGAIKREDPGFLCKAAISKRTVQTIETKVLLNKLYNGSLSTFLAEYLKNQDLSKAEVLELQRIIGEQRF